jgi:hypothetical protein
MNGAYLRIKEDMYFHEFKSLYPDSAEKIMREASYYPVFESYGPVWKSLDRMDYPNLLDRDDVFHKKALDFSNIMFGPVFTGTRPSFQFDITLDTSSGVPYKKMGMKTKDQALGSDVFHEMFENSYIPIWSIAGKNEFKPVEDIEEDKIRTFIIPPIDFLVKQKVLYTQQNQRLNDFKDRTWVKYGFVPQYGGFDDLFKRLESYDLLWSSDISGYDRKLQVMDEVYKIRNKFLMCPPQLEHVRDFVTEQTVRGTLLFPDGYLYRRVCGNNSGSYNTTPDNCIAHVIMMFRFLIKRWHDIYGSFPTYNDIMSTADVNIMSDDNCGGLLNEFYKFEDQSDFYNNLKANYSFYHLDVKNKALFFQSRTFDDPIEGLEFLGMTGVKKDGFYYPRPRVGKLCSRLVYADHQNHYWQVLARATALYMQSKSVFHLEPFIRNFLEYLVCHKDFTSCAIEHLEICNEAQSLLYGGDASFSYLMFGHEGARL